MDHSYIKCTWQKWIIYMLYIDHNCRCIALIYAQHQGYRKFGVYIGPSHRRECTTTPRDPTHSLKLSILQHIHILNSSYDCDKGPYIRVIHCKTTVLLIHPILRRRIMGVRRNMYLSLGRCICLNMFSICTHHGIYSSN